MTEPTKHRCQPLTEHTPLSPREEAFVNDYLVHFNAPRAAQAVGYAAGTGMRVVACRLLGAPHIQAAVRERMAVRTQRHELRADRVIEELASLFLEQIPNPQDLMDTAGNLRPIQSLTPQLASTIASMEVVRKNLVAGDGKTDVVVKYKIRDIRASKARVAELVMRHLGLLEPDPQGPGADVPAFSLPPETPGVRVH